MSGAQILSQRGAHSIMLVPQAQPKGSSLDYVARPRAAPSRAGTQAGAFITRPQRPRGELLANSWEAARHLHSRTTRWRAA